MMHQWQPSTLGHGETYCPNCCCTNREAAVLGYVDCPNNAPKLIPQGIYTCAVTGLGEVRQTKTGNYWFLPVELETGTDDKKWKIRIYQFGGLDTMMLLLDNKEHFIGQAWRVVITHKTTDGQTYYNARRVRLNVVPAN